MADAGGRCAQGTQPEISVRWKIWRRGDVMGKCLVAWSGMMRRDATGSVVPNGFWL